MWRFYFDGKYYVSFHSVGIAQRCAVTQGQSFINLWQVEYVCAVGIFQVAMSLNILVVPRLSATECVC